MIDYTPDRWVIVHLLNEGENYYKVLAGWSGGYLGSDRWRMNSGISRIEVDGDFYLFHGYSGSVYRCHKEAYGMTSLMSSVVNKIVDRFPGQIKVLDEFNPSTILEMSDE